MDCNIVKDLIPLYIDGCCSEKSKQLVEEHIKTCKECKELLNDMSSAIEVSSVSESPKVFGKINDLKAYVLQSVLLFLMFALITIGVSLEARTSVYSMNGFWALNLIIPATGFMLSLPNWYFVRLYRNKRLFSNISLVATIFVTLCGYVWSIFHYEIHLVSLLKASGNFELMKNSRDILFGFGIGVLLSILFCVSSKILSYQYAKLLGKE